MIRGALCCQTPTSVSTKQQHHHLSTPIPLHPLLSLSLALLVLCWTVSYRNLRPSFPLILSRHASHQASSRHSFPRPRQLAHDTQPPGLFNEDITAQTRPNQRSQPRIESHSTTFPSSCPKIISLVAQRLRSPLGFHPSSRFDQPCDVVPSR